ncbi:MAG: hypothetical protein ACOX4K_03145 [Bacillota bacterium]|jgi:hypothetical protein
MGEIFWSDISETFGLSKSTMRNINKRFGDILGITSSNKIPKSSLGAISVIANLQEQGIPDDEIEVTLLSLKTESGWPDVVLNRIQEQGATLAPGLEPSISAIADQNTYKRLTKDLPEPSEYSWIGCLERISQNHEPEWPLKEMFLDLRREICSSKVSEKEQIQRLTESVEILVREVRDLRYALVMASSRKDRKKGLRGLSRLLTR